jgi:methionine synthase II (cobalamin-independent)
MSHCKKIDENRSKLKTTVVGSFALDKTKQNMNAILDDQILLGLDFPGVPQLESMTSMFLQSLVDQECGIELDNGKFFIVDELVPPRYPVRIADLRYAKKYVERCGLHDRIDGFKVAVTGPFTLAERVNAGKTSAIFKEYHVIALAQIVNKIVHDFDKAGASIITVDEPVLDYGIGQYALNEECIIESLNIVFNGISRAITSVHVCGDIFSVNGPLLQLDNVDFLDHEFAYNPHNLKAYNKRVLEQYDKMIGLGCVITNIERALDLDILEGIRKGILSWKDAVETTHEIRKRIIKGIEQFGVENIAVVKPDCGFGGLKGCFAENIPHLITLKKLENMMSAVLSLRKES